MEYKCVSCDRVFKNASGLAGHNHLKHRYPDQSARAGRISGDKYRGKPGKKHTDESKDLLSRIACERISKHSKYTRNVEYKPGVFLESSFEVRTAEILDNLGIEWERVRKGYVWDDNGQTRRYIPDFYLPGYDLFLDPKNDYLIKKDQRKIESAMKLNNIRVVVLSDEQITEEFLSKMLLSTGVRRCLISTGDWVDDLEREGS